MTRRAGVALGLMAVGALAGCSAGASVSVPSAQQQPPSALQSSPAGSNLASRAATSASPSLPVDPATLPISLSHPSAEVQNAFDRCDVQAVGLAKIVRAGVIPHARDLGRYVPLFGANPYFQTDAPAVVLQFNGNVPQALYNNETWVNPICVVIDGQGGWVATGSRILSNGTIVSPQPAAVPPDLSLPTPQP